MIPPVRTAAPTLPPVTLDEIKAHCRVSSSDDDDLLTGLIEAAVDYAEGWRGTMGGICLVTQTWRQDLASFVTCVPRLPLSPVASITSVTYYDSDNAQQTLSTDVYALRFDELGAYLALKPDQSWPTVYDRDDAISVTFVAGSAVADVRPSAKAGIKLLVAHWYEHREGVVVGAPVAEVPMAVDALLGVSRRMNV